MATYLLLRLAGVAVPRLPEGLGRRLFEWIGVLTWCFAYRSRRAVQQNLARVLPAAGKRDLDNLSREVFRHCLLNYYDLVSRRRLRAEKGEFRVWGEDNLKAAQRVGKGIIIATAHLGSWNLVLNAAATRSWKVVVLTEPLRIQGMNRMTNRLRSGDRIRALPANTSGLKEAFRALKRGEMVVVACDRAIQGTGVRSPFMGEETLMPDGAVRLSARTGAPILPCFALRNGARGTDLYFEPHFVLGEKGDDAHSRTEGLSNITHTMERYIRRHPDQWMVFSPVWRERAIG